MPGTDKAESASVTGGGGFGVLSTSKYPEYAYKYIELFTSEDIQKYAYENYNVLPTIDALYKDENLVAEHEELAKFYPQFATAHQDLSLLIIVSGQIQYNHYFRQHCQVQLQ